MSLNCLDMRLLLLLMSLFLPGTIFFQVPNSEFEYWDTFNNREKPLDWYCPNLCPSPGSECGPCDKILDDEGDFSVRIHNVMPCIDDNNPNVGERTRKGFISTSFLIDNNGFNISYFLTIDSLINDAIFSTNLIGYKSGSFCEDLLSFDTTGLFSHRIVNVVENPNECDSIIIEFSAIGLEGVNSSNACDLGYINVIIDSVKVDQLTKVEQENEVNRNVEIFPNPVSSSRKVNIIANDILKDVIIYNSNGTLSKSMQNINSTNINIEVNDLLNGLHYIRVIQMNGVETNHKIIIE